MKLLTLYIKHTILVFFTLCMICPIFLSGQELLQKRVNDLPYFLKKHYPKSTFKPHHIKKITGHYRQQDWKTIIDTTWGDGLPTSEKLQIFDTFWNTIDNDFACFQDLDVNWDSLGTIYRSEVENDVSRGRFAAIMNHLTLALKESHTNIVDKVVDWDTLAPGVPLLVIGGWCFNDHFGAGLTPLPDSSLLVYQTVPDHPLGLIPGDIVLGYDGVPWKIIYPELLKAQLPISNWYVWGCSESAFTHSWLISAGMNWHLFDTLDVVKYSNGDTVHLSTIPLIDQNMNLFSTEQMDIPGVPKPDYFEEKLFTFGIIDGTNIGYIYAWGLMWNAEQEFFDAVNTLMFDYQTNGLIIDYRMNFGGNLFLDNPGLSLLFNTTDSTIGWASRSDPDDHLAMFSDPSSISIMMIRGDPETYYDKPIALLTGPGSVSGGDQNALRLKFHPMVRVFGKSTAAAFNGPIDLNLENTDWYCRYAESDAYLASNPYHYLTHDEFPVDEEVWLTRDDVAQGYDTVVKAAVNWIQNLCYAHDVTVDHPYAQPGVDSVVITAKVENPNSHNLSAVALLKNKNGMVLDSTFLFDDANHNDGSAGDGIWGNIWNVPSNELHYLVDVRITDIDSVSFHLQKNGSRFTTIGPVILGKYNFATADTLPNPGDKIGFRFTFKNEGSATTAPNISVRLSCPDTCISVNQGTYLFGSITPGETSSKTYYNWIQIGNDCPVDQDITFYVHIASEGYTFWHDTFSVHIYPTGIAEEKETIPGKFALNQNYPNPFNPATRISYSIPKSGLVNLKIYNILGQEILTLVNKYQKAGNYNITFDAKNLASGIYFYRLQVGDNYTKTKKMILMR
jgi:hypothetical protein